MQRVVAAQFLHLDILIGEADHQMGKGSVQRGDAARQLIQGEKSRRVLTEILKAFRLVEVQTRAFIKAGVDRADFGEKSRLRFATDKIAQPRAQIDAANL